MAQKVLGRNAAPRWASSLYLLAVFALSLVFAVTNARAEDLESCYEGVRARAVGNYDLAIDQFTWCIDAGELTVRNLAIAYNNRSYAYRKKTNYQQAIRDYGEAIRLDPEFAIAYYNRGVAHYYMQGYDQAIRDFGEAIRLDPEFAIAYYNRGVAHYYMREYGQAIRDYDEAIRLDTEFAIAYYNRGIAHYYMQGYDQAIRDYGEAIRLDPAVAQAYSDYTEVMRSESDDAEIYYNRATASLNKSDNDQAIRGYADAPYAEALVTRKPQAIPTATSSPAIPQALELTPPGVPEADRKLFAVHLVSVRTREGTKTEWKRLQRQFPELLGQRDLLTRTVDVEASGTFVRVLTGPFEDHAEAQDFCGELKSRGQYCLVFRLTDAT